MRTKLFFLFFFNGNIKLKQARENRPAAPSMWKVKARRSEKKIQDLKLLFVITGAVIMYLRQDN